MGSFGNRFACTCLAAACACLRAGRLYLDGSGDVVAPGSRGDACMRYEGSCHCGKIAFEVEGEFGEAIDCNCSLCRRRGGLLAFVARDKLTLTTPEADLS